MILPLYRAGYRPVYPPLGIVVADRLVTPMGRLSFSRVSANPSGPSPRSRSFARICAIGESARSVREIGRLPKIRTPGAQTGRCTRRRATITACRWDGIGGQRDRSATSSIDRDQRSARSLVAFVSLCHLLAIRQTASGRTTLAAEQLRPHRQRSPSPSVSAGAAEIPNLDI